MPRVCGDRAQRKPNFAREEPRVGTSALPYELSPPFACQAKAAIDNCRAGRAAKGATLVTDRTSGFPITPYTCSN